MKKSNLVVKWQVVEVSRICRNLLSISLDKCDKWTTRPTIPKMLGDQFTIVRFSHILWGIDVGKVTKFHFTSVSKKGHEAPQILANCKLLYTN